MATLFFGELDYRALISIVRQVAEKQFTPKIENYPKGFHAKKIDSFIFDVGKFLDEHKARFTVFPSGAIRMPERIGRFNLESIYRNRYKITEAKSEKS